MNFCLYLFLIKNIKTVANLKISDEKNTFLYDLFMNYFLQQFKWILFVCIHSIQMEFLMSV